MPLESTKPESRTALAQALPPLRLHPQLYEISTLPWLLGLSRKLGRKITISGVPEDEWQRLQDLGFDLVYLMGMWRRSPAGRLLSRNQTSLFSSYDECLPGWTLADVPGSPFSISAYEPDPQIGTWDELDRVHQQLNDLGMRVILDVIPNHTGPDHRWLLDHPEYYVRGTLEQYRRSPGNFFIAEDARGEAHVVAHGRDPNFAPWADTAQLNYFNAGLRSAMIDQIKMISEFCDGARCDMAMLVLTDTFHQSWEPLLGSTPAPRQEFWHEATRAVPDFIWIAEAYSDSEWALQQLGFTFTYDKRLYDRLRDGFVRDVYLHLKAEWDFQSRSLRFLENHDEARAAVAFGALRLPAVAVLATTVPGMHFINDGQLEGLKTRLVVQLARAKEEPIDFETLGLYKKILSLADAPEFHSQNWKLLESRDADDHTASDLIAYMWKGDSGVKLVVVNLGTGTASGRLYIADDFSNAAVVTFDDLLNNRSYDWNIADLRQWGLFIKLEAFGAHIFQVTESKGV